MTEPMSELESRLVQRLRSYTDPAVRPVDYLSEAQRIAATSGGWPKRSRWFVSIAAVGVMVAATTATVILIDQLVPAGSSWTPPGRESTDLLEQQVDRLFAQAQRCEARLASHLVVVTYPASWQTNESGADACTVFGPNPIEAPSELDGVPSGAAIAFGAVGGPPDLPADRSTLSLREDSTAGFPSVRVEETLHEPPGTVQRLTYWVSVGSGPSGGPTVVATTSTEYAGEYQLNKAVLDRMMDEIAIGEAE